ncbi:MAG: hypothetical protein M1549_02335 [Candidatus Dependentiae bacterium]|nr:hypothetical protein [Candidatus Dependentiae bacterium]
MKLFLPATVALCTTFLVAGGIRANALARGLEKVRDSRNKLVDAFQNFSARVDTAYEERSKLSEDSQGVARQLTSAGNIKENFWERVGPLRKSLDQIIDRQHGFNEKTLKPLHVAIELLTKAADSLISVLATYNETALLSTIPPALSQNPSYLNFVELDIAGSIQKPVVEQSRLLAHGYSDNYFEKVQKESGKLDQSVEQQNVVDAKQELTALGGAISDTEETAIMSAWGDVRRLETLQTSDQELNPTINYLKEFPLDEWLATVQQSEEKGPPSGAESASELGQPEKSRDILPPRTSPSRQNPPVAENKVMPTSQGAHTCILLAEALAQIAR